MKINAFDFDGVVSIGINPSPNDVIISGRCFDESFYINTTLRERGIYNAVYLNTMSLKDRGNHTIDARRYSGIHKARTIDTLIKSGTEIVNFFEDDEIQAKIIKIACPSVNVIMVISNLVEK